MMAETTGGVAIINSNIVGPKLERVADDFGSYYSLGYTPPHSGDGRFHAIEVKVKRKGLVVRHREGYRDKSTETRMTDGTLAALNFPYEDNPLGVELEFGQAARREDGYFVQQVAVKIPIGRLTLVPRSDSHDASVRVFVSAMDDEGGTSDVQQVQVPIKVPVAQVEAAKGQFYTYALSLHDARRRAQGGGRRARRGRLPRPPSCRAASWSAGRAEAGAGAGDERLGRHGQDARRVARRGAPGRGRGRQGRGRPLGPPARRRAGALRRGRGPRLPDVGAARGGARRAAVALAAGLGGGARRRRRARAGGRRAGGPRAAEAP